MDNLVTSLDDFVQCFPRNFWRQLDQQYLDPLEKQATKLIVEGVHSSLLNKSYYPSKPRYYIDKNKGRGVLRRIPVMEPRDYAVYFYCLKQLENQLSINRVESTYGGWSLGGLIRHKEEDELKPLMGEETVEWLNESSIPTFSYNRYAWVQYYTDYQRKLYAHLNKLLKDKPKRNWVAVKFDIENFYDSIRLNLLEKNIRAATDKNQVAVVDLLIHFIKYWNRDVNGYDSQQAGIPQDALADCSRILSNFYLQGYDTAINEYAKSNNSLYFRYSDDQIIIAESPQAAENALHKASLELSRLGLNINKAKVDYYTISQLVNHFSFVQFRDLTQSPNDTETLERVALHYLESNDVGKKHSLLYKLLGQDLGLLRQDLRTRLLADAYDKNFITIYANSNTLNRIYKNLGHDEQNNFVQYLDGLSKENEFTGFQFELLTFYRIIKKDSSDVVERIKSLHIKWL